MAGKRKMDADTMAALEVVNMEKAVAMNAEDEQKRKEESIKHLYEQIGKVKTMDAFEKIAAGGLFVTLKKIKDEGLYKNMPEFGTWQKVCDSVGLSRSKVDEELQNLELFGQQFIAATAAISLDRSALRKLRHSITDGSVVVDAEYVTIGEEKIPLSPDHTDELKEALEQVIEAKDTIIKEKDETIKAKDRVAQEKEKMIQKQAKEIAKYEGEAQKQGFKPGEEALLKKIEAARISFDGFYVTIDPEGNPMLEGDGATDRVKAAYMGLVAYMRTCVQAVYDTASISCGVPDDEDWLPEDMKI